MRLTPLFFTLCTLASSLVAQSTFPGGRVGGTIFDHATGDALIGATVLLEGTALGAATDLDGTYLVRNVPVGAYVVRISYIGYTVKRISDIVVIDGQLTKLDATLEEQSLKADEVVVTARALKSSEATSLSLRRQSASIGDGISAEMIKRAPDATSADALRRVVGVSIMDNKYVLVRGVSDRYNQTTLNGATMNSTDTESDKRSFSFDMIPSNLLDNTVVVKTSTPDRPGDVTGGLVELKTLDFPDQTVIRVAVGTSFNALATGKSILMSQGGSTDWLGMDDGHRSEPSAGASGSNEWASLPNSWAVKARTAPINQNISLAYGDRLVGEGFDVGYIAALSYRGSYSRTESYQDFVVGSGPFQQSGTNDAFSVLWGGLLDLHIKLAPDHKLSLSNAYNRTADDKVQVRSGIDFQGREVRSTSVQWKERALYNGQLTGEHMLGLLDNSMLAWRTFYTESNAKEPDRRRLKYQRQSGDDVPFAITGTENNERAWTEIREFTRGASADLTLPVADVKFKLGGAYEWSTRGYNVRFTSAEYLGTDFAKTFLSADSIFLPGQFGPNGWAVRLLSDMKDQYNADRQVAAGYLMADAPFSIWGERFRLVGGARLEDARLRAFTYYPAFINGAVTSQTDTASLRNSDIIPSVNLTYIVNEILNVRLAFSNSVNRPELREIANITYYDFVNYEELRGNPGLRRAWVDNYDARVEFYPDAGEVVAASLFYKKIYDAIEQRVVWSSNPGKEWINTPQAENYGWEFEFRKSFGFVNEWLERIQMTGNYTRILSKVQFRETQIVGLDSNFVPIKQVFTDIRAMQGQASYTLNLGLQFTDFDLGTSASVMYNRFGRRVEAVADIRAEDIFEEPRGTVDVSFTQKLLQNLELKLTGKDVTASVRRSFLRNGSVYRELRVGASYGMQLSYAL